MDRQIRNKILRKIPYGLFILGSRNDNRQPEMIVANWISQVSFEPPLISASIEADSEMRLYIERYKFFSINMLASGNVDVAKAFIKKSVRDDQSESGSEVTIARNGTPFVKKAIASLECKVVISFAAGDHRIFIGEVVDGIIHSDSEILTLKETGWKYNR